MMNYMKKATTLFVLLLLIISCDDSNDLLNEHIQGGPIIYAARVDSMRMQSGYNRIRVNIFPASDTNRSHCILSWNITSDVKDSLRMDYTEENYDDFLGAYYTIINFPPDDIIQGNLLIEAQNIDAFGNKSLVTNEGAYVYGPSYASTLENATIRFSPNVDRIYFEEMIGSVGNYVSYEKNNGEFTDEVFVSERSYPIENAKIGGILRSKTRFLISKNDIDAIYPERYLETVIRDESHIEKTIDSNEIEALDVFNPTYDRENKDYDTYGVDPITGVPYDGSYHNNTTLGPGSIFNGDRTTNAFYGYKFKKNGEFVQSFYLSYDLNVDVQLSSVQIYPRTAYAYRYKSAQPKRFRIWGTNDANQDKFVKFPETWTLIGEYVGKEPVDRDNLTPEETYHHLENNVFEIVEGNVDPDATPTETVRYIRIELLESYDPGEFFYCFNELVMKGYVHHYYYDYDPLSEYE